MTMTPSNEILVSVLMGSSSDADTMAAARRALRDLGIRHAEPLLSLNGTQNNVGSATRSVVGCPHQQVIESVTVDVTRACHGAPRQVTTIILIIDVANSI